jgi:hypothetical protein
MRSDRSKDREMKARVTVTLNPHPHPQGKAIEGALKSRA